jgi:hypothetical protein
MKNSRYRSNVHRKKEYSGTQHLVYVIQMMGFLFDPQTWPPDTRYGFRRPHILVKRI